MKILWAALILGAGASLLAPGTSQPIVPAKTALTWKAVSTKVDGSPVTDLAGYEAAVSSTTADLNTAGVALQSLPVDMAACSGGRCRVPLADLLDGLPDGPYRLWVRSVDLAGLASDWAGPVAVTVDSEAPPMPTGLRIEVMVTVGG